MPKERALIISESTVYTDAHGDFVSRGGGETCIHNLAVSLLELGIEVEVFGIQEYIDQRDEEIIGGVLYKRFPIHSRSSLKIFSYLRTALEKCREFDTIFLNQFTPHLILPFIKARKVAVIHDVYVGNGVSFWMTNYGFFRGLAGALIERAQLFFDRVYSDVIFTVSESSRKKILRFIGPSSEKKIVVDPFPIDAGEYISDRTKEDFLLFVGRFVDYKHPSHVLYVLRRVMEVYPNFKAVFVVPRAENAFMDDFYRLVHQYKIGENLEVKNFVSVEELRGLYARAKVLVQPSYIEGQGIVVLESLASGTPVVAYDLDAYEGMLIDGENSMLAEVGNMEALADGCLRILGEYEAFRNRCGVTLGGFSAESFREVLRGAIVSWRCF
ncbi:MAG: glycosyltransferase family 4 protein [Candidatus Peregrinibacteria bacterium]|nr:glycosyltransferase family 4 protein [Candidatus Peregrinibacteria bacterium]